MLEIRSSFGFESIQLSKVLLERNRKYVTRTFSSNGTDSLCKCAETQISHAAKVNSKKGYKQHCKKYEINVIFFVAHNFPFLK